MFQRGGQQCGAAVRSISLPAQTICANPLARPYALTIHKKKADPFWGLPFLVAETMGLASLRCAELAICRANHSFRTRWVLSLTLSATKKGRPRRPALCSGGDDGIRTHGTLLGVRSFSKRVPSASRPRLRCGSFSVFFFERQRRLRKIHIPRHLPQHGRRDAELTPAKPAFFPFQVACPLH